MGSRNTTALLGAKARKSVEADDAPQADASGSLAFLPAAVCTAAVAAAAAIATVAAREWRRRKRPVSRDAVAAAAMAREWAARDPVSPTGEEALAARPQEALARLAPGVRLKFGTAGLRARMGFGYDRMNVITVVDATEAVLGAMRDKIDAGCLQGRGVAVGFDARHNSRSFAIVCARVFAQNGVPVRLFSRPVPTPIVAFSVLEYGLAGSIAITASHNPAMDNGYKLFWSDGTQIRPDQAGLIEARMKRGTRLAGSISLDEVECRDLDLVTDPTEEVVDAYMAKTVASLRWRSPKENLATTPVVYTAMHGVGYPCIMRMFDAFGLPPVVPVPEQTMVPDPDFSTVAKPNPEENGALELAISTAKRRGLSLVLANDPDADRLGVAYVDKGTGTVRVFSGDEIAILLTDFLLQRYSEEWSNLAVATSAVSSRMLFSLAAAEGFECRETLTGFKWLSRAALDLAAEGKNILLAYEEALGYMLGTVVADKDGVSTAAVFAELAGHWATKDQTVSERMDELYRKYGFHLSNNSYVNISQSSPSVATVFNKAREEGLPTKLGQCSVVSVRDLTLGTDSQQADGKSALPRDSSTQFITFRCRSPFAEAGAAPDVILSLRGSGTEPKVKWYSEIRLAAEEMVRSGEGPRVLREAVEDAVEKVLHPRENFFEF